MTKLGFKSINTECHGDLGPLVLHHAHEPLQALLSSSSTAPFQNHMNGIIHLTDVRRVNWLVKHRKKFALVVSADF